MTSLLVMELLETSQCTHKKIKIQKQRCFNHVCWKIVLYIYSFIYLRDRKTELHSWARPKTGPQNSRWVYDLAKTQIFELTAAASKGVP